MRKRIFLSLFSLSLLLPVLVFAQTPSQAPSDSSIVPPSNAIILANIDLWDAKILSQDDHTIELSLDIHNGANVQPDIRYLVRVIQYSEDGTVEEGIADEHVYQDAISLNENETKTKRITYTAPDFFSGLYKLQVIARNTSGMPLGTANFGNVHFQSTLPEVRIDPTNCVLTVQGTDGQMDKTSFILAQGVDLIEGEKLFLTCPAENISKDSVTLRPFFTLYERINFGPRVTIAPSQETKEMSPYAKEVITFEVPMEKKPQSYYGMMTLQEKDTNKNVSISVPFRYVVRGESATIQNIIFDKSFYNKGDTATIKMFWSGSADDFPESRHGDSTNIGALMLKLSITASDQTLCAKEMSQSLDMTSIESKVTVPIEEACLNPTATLSLINSKGAVLASRTVTVESTQQQKADYEQMKSDDSLIPDSFSNIGIVTTLLAAFFILLAFLFFVRSRNKGSGTGTGTGMGTSIRMGGKENMFSLFLILLSSCFFLAPERASAVTWTATLNRNWHTVFTASTDKATYFAGENVQVSGTAETFNCVDCSRLEPRTRYALEVIYNGVEKRIINGQATSHFNSEGFYSCLFSKCGGICSEDCGSEYYDCWNTCQSKNTYWTNTRASGEDVWTATLGQNTVFLTGFATGLELNSVDDDEPYSADATLTINVSASNTAPNAPTISGEGGIVNQSLPFSFTATDPDGDQVKYGIDWDKNNSVDQWIPISGFVNSGTSQTANYAWASVGLKSFQALTQDARGNNSHWTEHSVTINDLTVNLTLNGGDNLIVSSGTPVTFQWTSTNADKCFISGRDFLAGDPLSSNGSISKTAGTEVSGMYTLTCKHSASGQEKEDNATLTVSCPYLEGVWSECTPTCDPDGTGSKERTIQRTDCTSYRETVSCSVPTCTPDGFKEVKP